MESIHEIRKLAHFFFCQLSHLLTINIGRAKRLNHFPFPSSFSNQDKAGDSACGAARAISTALSACLPFIEGACSSKNLAASISCQTVSGSFPPSIESSKEKITLAL